VPLGLKLAQWWKWEAPFLAIAAVAAIVWVVLFRILPPVREHLDRAGVDHRQDFITLLKDRNAWTGISLMMICVMGHFMVIPYLAPYLLGNVGLAEQHLFLVYLVGGIVTIFTGPFVGKLADKHGRFKVFVILITVACGIVYHLSTSGPLPLWHTLLNAAIFFVFASGRFIPAQATISLAVPSTRRGAYMSLVSCARDLTTGVTAAIGGMVVARGAGGEILHFDRLGLIAITLSLCSVWVFRQVRVAE
jgi:predicted MFS family arabinose efflux permease